MELIEKYKDVIKKLCKQYKVKSLYIFGSVLTDKFSDKSDMDILIDFNTNDPIEYTDNYFGFKFELEDILKRKIDVLESRALTKKSLLDEVQRNGVLVYES